MLADRTWQCHLPFLAKPAIQSFDGSGPPRIADYVSSRNSSEADHFTALGAKNTNES